MERALALFNTLDCNRQELVINIVKKLPLMIKERQ